jgi:hypothetical protein
MAVMVGEAFTRSLRLAVSLRSRGALDAIVRCGIAHDPASGDGSGRRIGKAPPEQAAFRCKTGKLSMRYHANNGVKVGDKAWSAISYGVSPETRGSREKVMWFGRLSVGI